MKRRVIALATSIVAAGVGSAVLSVPTASALAGTVSAAQFAAACAAGPVVLEPSVKVEFGSASVVGGCNVSIPPTGALEFVDATLSFGGPLVVTGSTVSKWEVIGSSVTAPSITATFAGAENGFKVDKAHIRATTGGINVAMGPIAMVQITYPSLVSPNSLQAAGAVTISGSDKMFLELNQSRIQAASALISLNGTEGVVKAEGAGVITSGAFSLTATGAKALVETSGSTFRAGSTATVALAGDESTLKGVATAFEAGGALVLAASSGAMKGLVELGGPGGVLRGSSVAVRSSTGAAGQFGTLNVTLNSVTATAGAATLDAGPFGAVTVKESSVVATTVARASTGAGGVCVAELNVITAPVQAMCV